MPDQPDDPINYEMKIPPEPKDATLHRDEQQSGPGEGADGSDQRRDSGKKEDGAHPSQSQSGN